MLRNYGASLFLLVRHLGSKTEHRLVEPSSIHDRRPMPPRKNPEPISNFIRFVWEADEANCELQTSIATYKSPSPGSSLQVDLVSTVHFADTGYFTTLQEELRHYDCVLYEMVADWDSRKGLSDPNSARRPKGFSSENFGQKCFAWLMTRVLKLDYQLSCLDYQASNWYHADLSYFSYKLIQLSRDKRSSTTPKDDHHSFTGAFPTVSFLKILIQSKARLNLRTVLKVMAANLLCTDLMQEHSETCETCNIHYVRNGLAIQKLHRMIDDGHTRIAILYGSAHMPDLGRQLREEFDLVPSQCFIFGYRKKATKLKTKL